MQKATCTGTRFGAVVAFIAVLISLTNCSGFLLYEISTIFMLFAIGLVLDGVYNCGNESWTRMCRCRIGCRRRHRLYSWWYNITINKYRKHSCYIIFPMLPLPFIRSSVKRQGKSDKIISFDNSCRSVGKQASCFFLTSSIASLLIKYSISIRRTNI